MTDLFITRATALFNRGFIMEMVKQERSTSASRSDKLISQSKNAKKKTKRRGWLCRHLPRLILFSLALNFSLLLLFTDFIPRIISEMGYHTVTLNVSRLNISLHSAIVGQDGAINIMIDEISKHLNSAVTQYPLIISVHGGSGTGKTKLTDILVQHSTPRCASKFVLPTNFLKVNEHTIREDIFKSILVNDFQCSFRVIVFEEIDYASAALISSLRDCLDLFKRIELNLARTVILFTSRIGETAIREFVIDLLQTGGKRQDVSFERTNDLILLSAFAASRIPWSQFLTIHKNITRLITFLPLEEQHVVHCIISRLKEQGLESFLLVERILADISFIPILNPVIAERGCKEIHSHVHYYGNL